MRTHLRGNLEAWDNLRDSQFEAGDGAVINMEEDFLEPEVEAASEVVQEKPRNFLVQEF